MIQNMKYAIYVSGRENPEGHLTFSEVWKSVFWRFYVAQICRSAEFDALNLWNVRSGRRETFKTRKMCGEEPTSVTPHGFYFFFQLVRSFVYLSVCMSVRLSLTLINDFSLFLWCFLSDKQDLEIELTLHTGERTSSYFVSIESCISSDHRQSNQTETKRRNVYNSRAYTTILKNKPQIPKALLPTSNYVIVQKKNIRRWKKNEWKEGDKSFRKSSS